MSKKEKELSSIKNSKKAAIIEATLAQINKKFGSGAAQFLGSTNKLDIDVISTGSLEIDKALGVGGLPRGRIVEIYGPESSGKTTLTLHVIAEAQKQGLTCAFIDAEHALDPYYAKKLGVNVEELLVSQPSNGEEALEICDLYTNSGAVDVIIIDSVAALVPKAEIEGEMGDSHMGLQARLMSQGLRKLTGKAQQNNVMLVFINQIRMKIGVMFGSPETTTGGNALKFYASVRLDIRRTGSEKDAKGGKDAEFTGNTVKIKVVKNKVAPPFKEAHTTILFGKGFDRYGELVTLGETYNIFKKGGAWYSWEYEGNENKVQGKNGLIEYFKNNPEFYEYVLEKVREEMKNDKNSFDESDFSQDPEEFVEEEIIDDNVENEE